MAGEIRFEADGAARRAVRRFAIHSATLDDVFLALTGRPADRPTNDNDKEPAGV